MLLTIEKMAQGGRGLSRLPDGRVCFVEGALPGEKVHVRLTKDKKDFAEGIAESIEEAHERRVSPRCPLYASCGGCNLQHADMELQLSMQRQVVEELFVRFAGTSLPAGWEIIHGEAWGYRNRARLSASPSGWGLRGRSSHHIVPLPSCPVFSKGLNAFLKNPPASLRAREVDIFDNGANGLAYWHPGMRDLRAAEAQVPLLGKQVSMDASVFFQSNLSLLPRLVEAVMEAAGEGEHAVDLFSGVGLFALFLQDRFSKVSAVERDAGCLSHARRHLGKNCSFVAEPAEQWLAVQGRMQGVDCLIVDPPRTGLPPSACEAIALSGTRKLIYVSCDPVTLARDSKRLISSGYTLDKAQGFAFYPQTSHFEMLTVFSRV